MEIIEKQVETTAPVDTVTPSNDEITFTQQLELSKFFGLQEPLDIKDKEKIQEINKFLMNNAVNTMGRMTVLQGIRSQLGAPRLGESELSKIHRYIKLMEQHNMIDKEIEWLRNK